MLEYKIILNSGYIIYLQEETYAAVSANLGKKRPDGSRVIHTLADGSTGEVRIFDSSIAAISKGAL